MLDRLSDREFEIFRLLGEGQSTRTIAERLRLSPKTVDAHRANIKSRSYHTENKRRNSSELLD